MDPVADNTHYCEVGGRDCLCRYFFGLHAGLNYLQSVTPRLSLGGEAFWLGQQRKSGTGFAARYNGEISVATAQIASTGLVSLAYMHRVSDKVGIRLLASLHTLAAQCLFSSLAFQPCFTAHRPITVDEYRVPVHDACRALMWY